MNSGNRHFDRLVESGKPVGEVVAINKFLVKVKGLQPCFLHALVLFEDGSKGYVNEVQDEYVEVLHLGSEALQVGSVAVLQHQQLVCKVGRDFIGRVVDVTGQPLDGKGPIAADKVWPVFNPAPPLYQRKLLDTLLETGVTSIDSLFPIVRGQRMALLGDSKSGKSTLATQLTINQKNTDQVVVYVLIAKRQSDVDMLLSRLQDTGGLDKAIVVVSTIFESLIMSYLAPYIAVSMAEYLWQDLAQDTVVIYDDLTAHAHAHREIALLSSVTPGRDSYPGDMFYAHSSLLERAGRLRSNGAHLTSIPIVNVPGGDITSYLSTNIMSITDGQWILDMNIFRNGVRPALSMGLSVTRIGGVGHNKRQKILAAQTLKLLADYREAEGFSHFGSELALESKNILKTGKMVQELMTQGTHQTYSTIAQELMMDILLNLPEGGKLDMAKLKNKVNEFAAKVDSEDSYQQVRTALQNECSVMLKGVPKTGDRSSTDRQPATANRDEVKVAPAPVAVPSEEAKKGEQ